MFVKETRSISLPAKGVVGCGTKSIGGGGKERRSKRGREKEKEIEVKIG